MARDRSEPILLVKLRNRPGEEFRIVTGQIHSFKYKDRERKADLCTFIVDNRDLANFDDPVWRKGAILVVQWGYPGRMSPTRRVVITSVKGFKQLNIEASALSVLMNRVEKCRVFENKTVSQAVTDIATENGFGSDEQFIDDTDEVCETLSQSRLTDAQFIRRWASRLGFEFFVDFDGFHFHERRLGARPVRVFRYHTDPGEGDILGEPSIENDLTAKPGRSKIKGRDPERKQDIDESADNDSDSDRDTLTEVIEIIDPDTGNATTVERNIASEETVPTADGDASLARRRARGRFRRAQQVAVKMTIPIVGDPLMFAKSVIQIEGMGKRLSVRYYVQEVEHDLATTGYVCNLRIVSDGHGGHSTDSRNIVGLSAIGVNPRGAGSGRGIDSQILDALRALALEAIRLGDSQTAAMVEKAGNLYRSRGNRSRAEVTRSMTAIANNSKADPALRNGAKQISTALAQRGGETESGGNPNRKDADKNADDLLEPFETIDPDTGRPRTAYRQSPDRGNAT